MPNSTAERKSRVLIVDDTPVNLASLGRVLTEDYEVSVATGGEQALRIAKSESPPDIILLDILMPEMNGYEVCRRLKEDEGTRQIPIIFVTSKSEEEDETIGLELGAVDYVTKPFSVPIVKARVKNHLELKRHQDRVEAANRAKSQFLAMMSHDLRTPMNTLLGMTDLLLQTSLSPEQLEYLNDVKSSGKFLLGLIDDVLDFSRMEAGKLELDPVGFKLRDFIGEALRPAEFAAREKWLAFVCDIHPEVPDQVVGDAKQLRQILLNLLSNAVKFTERGKVVVRAEPAGTEGKAIRVRFSVADTGIGIPIHRRKAIFDEFEQAEKDTQRRYGGTGLGLAICSRLVRLMGGRIQVQSDPGEGSVFYFDVCLEVAEEERADGMNGSEALMLRREQPPIVDQRDSGENIEPLRILVAEDDPMSRKLATHLLEKMGHKVCSAENGQQALTVLDERSFDVILMDVEMPCIDGLEATGTIRERESVTGRHIPIIAMTGHATEEDRLKCFRAGMDGYVCKPVNRPELSAAIRDLTARVGFSCERN